MIDIRSEGYTLVGLISTRFSNGTERSIILRLMALSSNILFLCYVFFPQILSSPFFGRIRAIAHRFTMGSGHHVFNHEKSASLAAFSRFPCLNDGVVRSNIFCFVILRSFHTSSSPLSPGNHIALSFAFSGKPRYSSARFRMRIISQASDWPLFSLFSK